MAQGEKKWSSKGKTVAKYDNTPLPPNEYDFRIEGAGIEQKKGDQPGKVPYFTLAMPALGTGDENTGKDKKVWHNLFLHANPGKDGKLQIERGGGVLDLAAALGQEVEFSTISVKYCQYDAKGSPKGEMKLIPILKPSEVLAWLKGLDGTVVRGQTKIENSPGFNPKTVISYFIPSDDSASSEVEEGELDELDAEAEEGEELEAEEGEAEESIEEEADLDEDAEDVEDAEEEVEEADVEEDMTASFNPKAKAAAAAAKAKTGSKVVQGPAKKGGKKSKK